MRRPACDGVYRSPLWGSLTALASEHAAHPSRRPEAREGGASVVSEGNRRRRVSPRCRRRWRQAAASRGDITLM
eukprot:4557287-Pleurochrysis_carterae.AAC.1